MLLCAWHISSTNSLHAQTVRPNHVQQCVSDGDRWCATRDNTNLPRVDAIRQGALQQGPRSPCHSICIGLICACAVTMGLLLQGLHLHCSVGCLGCRRACVCRCDAPWDASSVADICSALLSINTPRSLSWAVLATPLAWGGCAGSSSSLKGIGGVFVSSPDLPYGKGVLFRDAISLCIIVCISLWCRVAIVGCHCC